MSANAWSRTKLLNFALIVLGAISIVSAFQNCGISAFGTPVASLDLPLNHPSGDGSVSTATIQSKVVLGDRDYLESVFRDVFLSDQSSINDVNTLNYFIAVELSPMTHILGRSCDVSETGDGRRCEYLTSNTQLAMNAATSSAREAARIQLCRRATSHQSLLLQAVNKVRGTNSTPNDQSILNIVRLFYPFIDDVSASEIQSSLAKIDRDMKQASELPEDRWRILVLTVCESPGWEIL